MPSAAAASQHARPQYSTGTKYKWCFGARDKPRFRVRPSRQHSQPERVRPSSNDPTKALRPHSLWYSMIGNATSTSGVCTPKTIGRTYSPTPRNSRPEWKWSGPGSCRDAAVCALGSRCRFASSESAECAAVSRTRASLRRIKLSSRFSTGTNQYRSDQPGANSLSRPDVSPYVDLRDTFSLFAAALDEFSQQIAIQNSRPPASCVFSTGVLPRGDRS